MKVDRYPQAPWAKLKDLPKGDSDGNCKKPNYDQSLFKALFITFFYQIWTAGILKLMAGKFSRLNYLFFHLIDQAKTHLDTLNTTTPLLTEVLLTWLTDSFAYFRLTDAEQAAAAAQGLTKPLGLGYGIGLAFALFIMQGENGSTTFLTHFSNANVEAASLVSDALHLHLSLIELS